MTRHEHDDEIFNVRNELCAQKTDRTYNYTDATQ